jgi:hypothetical protein
MYTSKVISSKTKGNKSQSKIDLLQRRKLSEVELLLDFKNPIPYRPEV